MMNVNSILQAGSQTGLGYAERVEVEQLLADDPEAQIRWHRTHAFLPGEQVLDAGPVASFARWLSGRHPHPTTAPSPPATTGRGAAGILKSKGKQLVCVGRAGAGMSRWQMQAPDDTEAREQHAAELIASGHAKIAGGTVTRFTAADFETK